MKNFFVVLILLTIFAVPISSKERKSGNSNKYNNWNIVSPQKSVLVPIRGNQNLWEVRLPRHKPEMFIPVNHSPSYNNNSQWLFGNPYLKPQTFPKNNFNNMPGNRPGQRNKSLWH
jgi:hypothetical protein